MNYFIFDVDGTLIDSEQMYMLPLQKVLKKHGYDVSDAAVEKVFGITAADA
ncbi:HAD hydrolase-like protein [Lentilactobacillus parafarraginis]|nr:HAD hydrolase-like protein [Lentilactobacillus parafarraginis]